MTAPRTWLCCTAVVTALCAGCGGSDSEPKPEKVIQSPTLPPTGVPRPQAPPAAAAPRDAANLKPKLTPTAKAKPSFDPFEDHDPKNVFEIAGEAPLWEVGTNSDPAHIHAFLVEDYAPGTNSSDFEIADVAGGTGSSSPSGYARNPAFELPAGFVAVESYGYSEQGLPLRIRDEKSEAWMALVPGGVAHIGSTDGPPETQPPFTPIVDTFYMDITEVTLGQYQAFRDDIKRTRNSNPVSPLNDGDDPNLPALGLPWGVASGFARWSGKELPTEAEFEYAARGPRGWRTPWGDGKAVWPRERTPDLIAPVATFPTDRSEFGIYDLAGNAREWCADNYSETAHQEAASASSRALHNWSGPIKASVSGHHVVKGNGPDWSAWRREGRAGNDRFPDVGFRCVLRVKVPPAGDGRGS